LDLLKEKYKINKIPSEITEIIKYPWYRVYTTNYDNAIEKAFESVGIKPDSYNNTDTAPVEMKKRSVVHLHGQMEKWNINNFGRSCVLDVDSYLDIDKINEWLERLRTDVECADVVIFCGFSASDFHLNKVFFHARSLKEKSFFINRVTASPDSDEKITQSKFGKPCYIGRSAFAGLIQAALASPVAPVPSTASFKRRELPPAPTETVPTDYIEKLFVWGSFDNSFIKRDIEENKSISHVVREELRITISRIKDPGAVVLLHGDICDGKSIILTGAASYFTSSRPIFEFRNAYNDIVAEVAEIISYYKNPLFLIENIFVLTQSHLLAIARQVASSEASMIMTSRNIAFEVETTKLRELRKISSFSEIVVGRLGSSDIEPFVDLLDQVGGWADFRAMSSAEKERYVSRECGGVIPSVLLRLFNSNFVQERYQEEFNKIDLSDDKDRKLVVAIMLVSSIGLDAKIQLLSDIFERDTEQQILNLNKSSNCINFLVRIDNDVFRTVPSIGSRNIFRKIISDRDIVDVTVDIAVRIAGKKFRFGIANYLMTQFMRYSVLSAVIEDSAQVNRFFDVISKVKRFREMPLFWLQWHMAVSAQRRWGDAERYLNTGYNAADLLDRNRTEKFDRRQLDDRRAKLFLERAIDGAVSDAQAYKDSKFAVETVLQMLTGADLTHHPFETLSKARSVLLIKSGVFSPDMKKAMESLLNRAYLLARQRVEKVPAGYQRRRAEAALSPFTTMSS
jgi:hypothetical protein